MDNIKLLENRLAFISCHRDRRESLPGIELFHGEPSFFKNAYLFEKNAIKYIPPNFQLHVPDWVLIDEILLKDNNWIYSSSIIYMVLKNNLNKCIVNPEIEVKKITDEKDLELYCKIQSQGFEREAEDGFNFYEIMLASSRKNFHKSNHYFYLASLNGNPAGVALSYFTGKIMGIYSVATIPEFRGQGVSTNLMKMVMEDGILQGAECVTLQTMAGIYAESFYKKLGFERVFECRIFKRQI